MVYTFNPNQGQNVSGGLASPLVVKPNNVMPQATPGSAPSANVAGAPTPSPNNIHPATPGLTTPSVNINNKVPLPTGGFQFPQGGYGNTLTPPNQSNNLQMQPNQPTPPLTANQIQNMPSAPPGSAPSANLFNPPATQSVEQQALAGGSNPQQISNFMKALQNVGAGSNNTFQNAPANNPQVQQAAPLYANGAGQLPQQNLPQQQTPYTPINGASQQQRQFQMQPQATGLSSAPINAGTSVPTSNIAGFSPGVSNVGLNAGQQAAPWTNPGVSGVGLNGGLGGIINSGSTSNSGLINQNASMPIQQQTAGLGSSALISDENAKTNIKSAPKRDLQSFLDNLGAHKYDYKDKADGDKEGYVSPMAQELEKSKLGKTMVETRPDGKKQVNYGRGFGIITAAQSLLHERLADIEKELKMKHKNRKGK